MMTFSFGTGKRTGSFTPVERRATQAAVMDDILRCAPTLIGDLPASVPLLLTALANHHSPTYVHSLRVAQLAWWLTYAQEYPPPACQWAFIAGMLHDIGKIHIPRSLLQENHAVIDKNIDSIQMHVVHGAQLLQQYADVAALAPIIVAQYERPDGRGAPKGLRAPKIPTPAYVLAVAEALDMLATPPIGTPPASVDEMCEMLLADAGYRWDARVATIAAQFISRHARNSSDPALVHEYADERLLVA